MKYVITLCFLLTITKAFSQISCATDLQHQYLLNTSPEYKKAMENRAAPTQNYRTPNTTNATPDTIPVVVHIIHLGGAIGAADNPSDAAIQTMINNLNGYYDGTYLPDIELFFKLAQRDTICQSTTGIVRVNGSVNSTYVNDGVSIAGGAGITQSALAGLSFWDNRRYLNIWVINKMGNSGLDGLGYFPTGGSTTSDGVLIRYSVIANGPLIAHEIGHSFNLRHIFEGSNGTTCPLNTNCNTQGDMVCDTYPVLENTNGCDQDLINPCTSMPYGEMVINLMSYSCGSIFTVGQKDRMRAALTTYRSTLLTSQGELPPPCPVLPIKLAAFEAKNTQCNKIWLQWKTTQEQNNKGFYIEQSTDGISFTPVAFVKGNGNTSNTSTYNFTTNNLSNSKYYFRLKQIDYDGRFEYSSIITASIICDKILYSIYPNPVANSLTLSTNSNAKNNIAICNMYGQVVKKWNNTNQKTFNLNGLASGTYTLLINETTKLKFVKN